MSKQRSKNRTSGSVEIEADGLYNKQELVRYTRNVLMFNVGIHSFIHTMISNLNLGKYAPHQSKDWNLYFRQNNYKFSESAHLKLLHRLTVAFVACL